MSWLKKGINNLVNLAQSAPSIARNLVSNIAHTINTFRGRNQNVQKNLLEQENKRDDSENTNPNDEFFKRIQKEQKLRDEYQKKDDLRRKIQKGKMKDTNFSELKKQRLEEKKLLQKQNKQRLRDEYQKEYNLRRKIQKQEQEREEAMRRIEQEREEAIEREMVQENENYEKYKKNLHNFMYVSEMNQDTRANLRFGVTKINYEVLLLPEGFRSLTAMDDIKEVLTNILLALKKDIDQKFPPKKGEFIGVNMNSYVQSYARNRDDFQNWIVTSFLDILEGVLNSWETNDFWQPINMSFCLYEDRTVTGGRGVNLDRKDYGCEAGDFFTKKCIIKLPDTTICDERTKTYGFYSVKYQKLNKDKQNNIFYTEETKKYKYPINFYGDKTCKARAILIAIAQYDYKIAKENEEDYTTEQINLLEKEYNDFKNCENSKQYIEARKLYDILQICGFDGESPYTTELLPTNVQYISLLKGFYIYEIDWNNKNELINHTHPNIMNDTRGLNRFGKKKIIFILNYQGHSNPLLSVSALTNKENFCEDCLTVYDFKRIFHKCKNAIKCRCCGLMGKDHYEEMIHHRDIAKRIFANNEAILNYSEYEEEYNNYRKEGGYPYAPLSWFVCKKCNRGFAGQECFAYHENKKFSKNMCETRWKCKDCNNLFEYRSFKPKGTKPESKVLEHICFANKCPNCKFYGNLSEHQCFMKNCDIKKPATKFIFFDFESRLEKSEDERGQIVSYHIPNCVSVQRINLENPKQNMKYTFYNSDKTLDEFCDWLFTDENKYYTCISHNFKGYDSLFISQYIIKKFGKINVEQNEQENQPEIQLKVTQMNQKNITNTNLLCNGNKMFYLEYPAYNMRFIDSYNFINKSLREFAKTFCQDEGSEKGDYPYLFNTKENENYQGPIPPIEYWALNERFSNDVTRIYEYYEKRKDLAEFVISEEGIKIIPWDNKKELIKYCENDVEILKNSWFAYRNHYLELTQGEIDPTNYMSVSELTLSIFRQQYLVDKTIPIVKNDMINADIFSHESICFFEVMNNIQNFTNIKQGSYDILSRMDEILNYQKEHPGTVIRHALNGGEVEIIGMYKDLNGESKISRAKVDGYVEALKTVIQYHGCTFHGCRKCFKNPKQLINGKTVEELEYRTKCRTISMINAGYKVIEIWSHEWVDFLKYNTEIDKFCKGIEKLRICALNPRKAFYGARVGCNRIVASANEKETIRYLDIVSMYPYIMKTKMYPTCHPQQIKFNQEMNQNMLVNGQIELGNIQGLIHCDVIPPKGLIHPVLPIKVDDKLFFPLCYECSKQKGDCSLGCNHSDNERKLRGIWTHFELLEAQKCGYKIRYIYEAHHFDTWSDDLFTKFIDNFYAIKQEAEGYPEWAKTEEDKDKYVENVFKETGIQLNKERISKNPGLRAVAKQPIVSLWGKFGQNEKRIHREFVTPSRLHELLINPNVHLYEPQIMSEDCLYVQWEYIEEPIGTNYRTNIYISIFTASYARLKLLSILQKLQDKVIYYDTDCVFFYDTLNENGEGLLHDLEGNNLGNLKEEHSCHILDFITTGPKSYAFKDVNGGGVCKVKGFSLNINNSSKINFDTITHMVSFMRSINLDETLNSNIKDELIKSNSIVTSKMMIRKSGLMNYNQGYNIRSFEEIKKFNFSIDNRIIDWTTGITYPHGF